MKSVVLIKHEFENQDEFISRSVLAFVIHQDNNAEKMKILLGQKSLKSIVLSTATLFEEVLPDEA